MDSDQAGPSRPHQPVLRLREAETELDPEILSGLLAHYNFDDTKLSGAAIINQEVNGIFDDLEQMKGLLLEMKGWKAEDVMQGFESAYTAVEHAINRVSMVAEEVGEEVACALRTSLRDLRRGILALEANLEAEADRAFVVDLVSALPELDEDIKEKGKGKGKGKAREAAGSGDNEMC